MKMITGIASAVTLAVFALECGDGGGYSIRAAAAEPAFVQTSNELELRQEMREVWAEHVVYTRDYIIAAVDGHSGADAVLDRLMENQEDIGNAVATFYGEDAGGQLTGLLQQHIEIAGELVGAAIAKQDQSIEAADERWHENATEIADFLSEANPSWSSDDLESMLNEHLELTKREATLRLEGDWAEDVANFDEIFDQSMEMADALSDGILKQFPDAAVATR